MKRHIICLGIAFLAINLLFSPLKLGAAPQKKINASFDAFAYANPLFWIAKDLGLFERYGLDVDLLRIAAEKGVSAMVGGSTSVIQVGGITVVSAAVQGMDVVILGTVFDRLTFSVHASDQSKESVRFCG